MGPMVYVKHLLSESRLPFTAAYLGSIGMTLFSAIGVCFLAHYPPHITLFLQHARTEIQAPTTVKLVSRVHKLAIALLTMVFT